MSTAKTGSAVALAATLTSMIASGTAWANGAAEHGHYWGDGGGWWGMMFLGPLMMILFLAAIVAVVVLVVRWLGSGAGATSPGRKSALDVLDERFARGEIEREEYLEKKQDLA